MNSTTATTSNDKTELRRLQSRISRALSRHDQQEQQRVAEGLSNFLVSLRSSIDATAENTVNDIVVRSTSVLASLGLNTPISVEVKEGIDASEAYTNFRSINLTIGVGRLNVKNPTHQARLVGLVKGLIYHEAGHILYSVPFGQLKQKGISRWDSPFDHDADPRDNARLDMHLKGIWGIFEDQRMEAAVLREFPAFTSSLRIAANEMIIRRAVEMGTEASVWPLLIGRHFLSSEIREAFKSRAEQYARMNDLVDDLAIIEYSIERYMSATTEEELFMTLVDAAEAVENWMGGKMEGQRNSSGVTDNFRRVGLGEEDLLRSLVESASNEPLRRDDSDADSGDSCENNNGSSSRSKGTTGRGELNAHLDKEAMEAAGFTTHHVQSEDLPLKDVGFLPHHPSIFELSDSHRQQAVAIQGAMAEVFRQFLVVDEPMWTHESECGVLDPVQYRVRESGDTAFWISRDEKTRERIDLAVSVVLDVSGSMNQHVLDLAISAHGIRLACDDLDVPCTLTTFDTESYLLLDATESTRAVGVSAGGGTDPDEAIAQLVHQRHDRFQHLVLVLTDGIWETGSSMDLGRTKEMYAVGIGFGQGIADCLQSRGFDAVIGIDSLDVFHLEVAKQMNRFLLN